MQEGLAALAGYGAIFREHVRLSGVVPQISIVCGPAAGGSSYGPALNDFVIMSGRAAMFLTGPAVVAEVTGEAVDMLSLGGARVHERNGVCHLTAPTEADAALLARDLLSYLPQRAGDPPPRATSFIAPHSQPDHAVPKQARRVYDVRRVAESILDVGSIVEISPRWARNIVCAFARIQGQPLGLIASQPQHLGGVLDSQAAEKAARFVRTCDAYGLPLLVLVDTPGFLPGVRQEREGVIRHGAKLLRAFAQATVPSVTVIMRKAFGGAYIAMNSKALGADYVFAWPGAQVGVMGPTQAVGIIERRAIAAAADPGAHREQLAARYAEEHLSVETAGADGFIDEVIAPGATRATVCACLEVMADTQANPSTRFGV
jgi:acetyl-CoA carboxylase carboxyltransferase component